MAICCPKTFTGFCLADNTPIAITIDNGVLLKWTNLVTGVVTPGNPPAGTGICEVPSTVIVEIAPLTCIKDAVTVCQGTSPWVVSGTVSVTEPVTVDGTLELGAATLAALETITVNQGTSPWVVTGSFSSSPLTCETDSITVCPPVSGTFDVSDPNVPDLTGTWAYEAGVSGTEIIGAGRRVIGITAHAGLLAGSMTINGGDVIPIPANSNITIEPYGQLVAPTIVFTGTESYMIDTLI